MIHDQDLPMFLWGEASNTTVYVQNRVLTGYWGTRLLRRHFTSVKPEVSHLRIFGCPVYIHVPKEKRTKLEPSGRRGTFVGYNETSKAYKIYIPGQRQIEVSRDVTFDEEVAFRRSRESLTWRLIVRSRRLRRMWVQVPLVQLIILQTIRRSQ
jgi:hypothetical protein